MCKYRDGCDADSREHLFDQSVSIIERLHHQTLLSGDLREKKEGFNTPAQKEMTSSKMSVTYWSTVQTLVVQQVLLKDGLFTGQLLLGHLLQKHSSSCDSDIAFNIFWTNTSTCYLFSVYSQKGGIMNVLSLKESGKEWLLNAIKVLSIL